ncbi:hypothetical protein PSTEL_07875 [Paenibacillus stellifer]|uniref:Uncharacterized protein n=1 Tax=Paenibacillus stellifer TaxID=169760 RepID=A0A089LSF7_9BACL|nr:hypothetical protein [Paenibacillus stellifer]AIQ63030.1 hypothetical protein PSTEL_07875 [Paenibacillus stellifer]
MTGTATTLLFKSVCFAPSEYFGNSPESREFGEKIAEVPIIIDLFKVPLLKLRWETVADELSGSRDGIRGAMYSRFIGKPGERYFLCGDARYYQQVHELPARARMSGTAGLLQVQYKMMGLGPRNMAYVTPLLTNISLAEIRQMTVKDIGMAASIMLLLSSSDAQAAAVPDKVLAGNAQAVPSLPAHIAAVTNQDAWMLRVWTEQGVRKAIEEAVAAGDTGLISLSAAPVYERASESSPGDRLGAPPVGRLYLVKVKESIGKLPQLYEEFDISGYAVDKQRFTRTRMFGSFTVDSP